MTPHKCSRKCAPRNVKPGDFWTCPKSNNTYQEPKLQKAPKHIRKGHACPSACLPGQVFEDGDPYECPYKRKTKIFRLTEFHQWASKEGDTVLNVERLEMFKRFYAWCKHNHCDGRPDPSHETTSDCINHMYHEGNYFICPKNRTVHICTETECPTLEVNETKVCRVTGRSFGSVLMDHDAWKTTQEQKHDRDEEEVEDHDPDVMDDNNLDLLTDPPLSTSEAPSEPGKRLRGPKRKLTDENSKNTASAPKRGRKRTAPKKQQSMSETLFPLAMDIVNNLLYSEQRRKNEELRRDAACRTACSIIRTMRTAANKTIGYSTVPGIIEEYVDQYARSAGSAIFVPERQDQERCKHYAEICTNFWAQTILKSPYYLKTPSMLQFKDVVIAVLRFMAEGGLKWKDRYMLRPDDYLGKHMPDSIAMKELGVKISHRNDTTRKIRMEVLNSMEK